MKNLKKCNGCNQIKLRTEFHFANKNKNKLQVLCKDCRNAKRRNDTRKKKEEYNKNNGIISGTDKCTICELIKPINEFKKNRTKSRGYDRTCLVCYRIKNSETYYSDIEKSREKSRKYSRIRRQDPNCRKVDNEKNKQFFIDNPDYRIEYEKNRREDPLFRLKKNLSRRIRYTLNSKKNKTIEYLGCSIEELKQYLEKQFYHNPETGEIMSWKNYGLYGWHIDHIIPLSSANNAEDIIKLFHYTNLQPLWAKENLQKSSKLNWSKK